MDIQNWDTMGGDGSGGGPTGIPDPNNPGYDTAGWPLADQSSYPVGGEPGRVAHPSAPTPPGGVPPAAPDPTPPPVPPPPPAPGPLSGILAPFREAAPAFPNEPAFVPPPAFSYADFKPPSVSDAFDDPGYQWERGQTLDALNRDAAAKGILNDSGTAQAFLNLGNNIASTRLGDVYNRAFQTYGMNRQNALDNYNTNYKTRYVDPYVFNRQSQILDPYQAAFAAWQQRGNWYNQTQGTAANAAINFGNMI